MRSRLTLAVFMFTLVAPFTGAAAQGPTAAVNGSVTDAASGEGVPGVRVRLADGLTGVTNGRGAFEIKQVPWGVYEVLVSRIGYRSKVVELTVAGGPRGIYLVVVLDPIPVELEPVVIRGDTATIVAYGRMADFFRRKRVGWGRFVTRQDIERWNPFRVSDLLRTVPGVWVTYDRWGQPFFSFRGTLSRAQRCMPAVYVDNMRMPADMSLDEWVMPHVVEGIEVYNSMATTPPQFYGGCGAIVVWTR